MAPPPPWSVVHVVNVPLQLVIVTGNKGLVKMEWKSGCFMLPRPLVRKCFV